MVRIDDAVSVLVDAGLGEADPDVDVVCVDMRVWTAEMVKDDVRVLVHDTNAVSVVVCVCVLVSKGGAVTTEEEDMVAEDVLQELDDGVRLFDLVHVGTNVAVTNLVRDRLSVAVSVGIVVAVVETVLVRV